MYVMLLPGKYFILAVATIAICFKILSFTIQCTFFIFKYPIAVAHNIRSLNIIFCVQCLSNFIILVDFLMFNFCHCNLFSTRITDKCHLVNDIKKEVFFDNERAGNNCLWLNQAIEILRASVFFYPANIIRLKMTTQVQTINTSLHVHKQ